MTSPVALCARRGASLATAAVCLVLLSPPSAQAGNTIFFPLRWCALEGSPAVTNPAGVGEATLNDVLWRRHERATDFHWIPGANISFRSAFTAEAAGLGQFPVIADPRPPAAGGPGQLGDIEYHGQTSQELTDAIAACRTAWNNLDTMVGTHFPGPVVLNVRKTVNADGTDSNSVGVSCFGCVVLNAQTYAQFCGQFTSANPPAASINESSAFSVVWDNAFTGSPPAPGDTLLAHEIGHVLFLGHGNGLDDDGDDFFDGCDAPAGGFVAASLPGETSNSPNTLMGPGGGQGITALQSKVARAIAIGSPGGQQDPPGTLIPGPSVSDEQVDRPHDAADRGIDLVAADVSRDRVRDIMTISHVLYGTIRGPRRGRYATFLDLDRDASTGGRPADLGFNTGFKGADLVTLVETARRGRAHRVVRARAWSYLSGAFRRISDKRILRAYVQPARPSHPEGAAALFDAVNIELSTRIQGVDTTSARIEALARRRGGKPFDRLPDRRRSGIVRLVVPRFPVCSATAAPRGGTTTVEFVGLVRDRGVHVVLGDRTVAKGGAAKRGEGKVDFVVPEDVREGPHLVTVGTDGTAITADCVLEVVDKG